MFTARPDQEVGQREHLAQHRLRPAPPAPSGCRSAASAGRALPMNSRCRRAGAQCLGHRRHSTRSTSLLQRLELGLQPFPPVGSSRASSLFADDAGRARRPSHTPGGRGDRAAGRPGSSCPVIARRVPDREAAVDAGYRPRCPVRRLLGIDGPCPVAAAVELDTTGSACPGFTPWTTLHLICGFLMTTGGRPRHRPRCVSAPTARSSREVLPSPLSPVIRLSRGGSLTRRSGPIRRSLRYFSTSSVTSNIVAGATVTHGYNFPEGAVPATRRASPSR